MDCVYSCGFLAIICMLPFCYDELVELTTFGKAHWGPIGTLACPMKFNVLEVTLDRVWSH